jgi:hypothetical protein
MLKTPVEIEQMVSKVFDNPFKGVAPLADAASLLTLLSQPNPHGERYVVYVKFILETLSQYCSRLLEDR